MRRLPLLLMAFPVALFAHAAGVESYGSTVGRGKDDKAAVPASTRPAFPAVAQVAYAGDDACLRCHYEFARKWHEGKLEHHSVEIRKTNLQSAIGAELNKTLTTAMPTREERKQSVNVPAAAGCETCHGPGSFHNSGLRGEIVRWPRFRRDTDARDSRRLTRKAQDEICLPCHAAKFTARLEEWQQQPHALMTSRQDGRATPACVSCHEMHRANRVHSEHLVREPTLDANCTQARCHGANAGKGTDIATKSHSSRGLFHHPLQPSWKPGLGGKIDPAKEVRNETLEKARTQGCVACHSPHGTSHLWELNGNFQGMCADCHDQTDPKSRLRNISYWPFDHEGETDRDRFGKRHVELYKARYARRMPVEQASCVLCHGVRSCADSCHRTTGSTEGGRQTRRYRDPGSERARHKDDFYLHQWLHQAAAARTY